MRRRRTERQRPLMLCCNVIILIGTLLLVNAQEDPSLDYSCGTDWVNAANSCSKHCPSGHDKECEELGLDHGCYYFTGCKARFEQLKKEEEEQAALEGGNKEEEIVEIPPEQNQFCAPTFIEAMLKCSKDKACPIGNECGEGEACFGNTNCDRELQEPTSDMVFTLKGPTGIMEDEDLTIFKSTIFAVLQQSLSDVNIHLDTLSVTNQRYFSADDNVEVSVLLTAKYRPPPRTNLDSIVENSINLQKESVKAAIKQAANDVKQSYFSTLNEISAVSRENATNRPTLSPTGAPNFSPTSVPSLYPTASPSGSPTSAPSDVPSSSPSRMHIQEVVTATSNELKSSTDASYGVVFNMRTAINGPVVLINGLDFYTESTDFVGYELWSRLGSFKDFKGNYEGWDLIASGVVKGAGYGKFTSIPSNTLTEVSIPGRGGERAFYLTLNSMGLIYGANKVESGDSDSRVHASSPELEIYEGEAVLSYPFPDPTQAYMYRSPRLFLGVVQYDRMPCKPFSLYGPVNDLPCAEIPTMTPTTKRPTPQPTTSPTQASFTEEPSVDPQTPELPTVSPLFTPSLSPSISSEPTTSTSPTLYPTSSPVVLIKAYIVVTLRNTLDRDMSVGENGGFFDMFLPFLRKHCKRAMMVENIELWSEEQINVVAPLVSSATYSTPVVATRAVEGRRKVQATRLTLVLQISSTTLPLNLLGSMATVAIEENQGELLTEIGVLGELYQFFSNVDQVVSFSIDSVTDAPVASPAEKDASSQELTGGITNEEEVPTPARIVIGVIVAIIWALLATFSIFYLTEVRSKMNDKRISEDMEKIDPLNPDTRDGSSKTYSKQTSTETTDISDRSGDNGGRRIGVTKMDVARSFDSKFPRQGRDENLSRSLPILSGQDLALGLKLDDVAKSIDLDGMEIGLRQNLRSSLNRSGSQRNLNMRGSLRESVRLNDGIQDHLRASMQRSDSQGNLRMSLRESVRRSDGKDNLRASMQRSDSQGNLRRSLRESVRLNDGQDNLRASMQRSDSQGNLRMSLRESVRRSDGKDNLRASMQRSDSQGNLRRSLRESVRLNDGQDNLRASMQRSDSQGNLRRSLRESLRRSDGQDNLRASMQRSDNQSNPRSSGNRGLRGSGNIEGLRGSGKSFRGSGNIGLRGSGSSDDLRGSGNNLRGSGNKGLRGSSSSDDLRGSGNNLRGSGNRGLRGSGSNDDLRGSGNNLRGSGNRGLRGSGKHELKVSFLERDDMTDHDNNVRKQRRDRNTDLSKSMTALDSCDIAREGSEDESLRRSGGNILIPQPKAGNGNIGKLRRSTERGTHENAGLKGSGTKGNNSTLRRSVNKRSSDALESLTRSATRGSADNLTGLSRSGKEGNDVLRRSGSKRSSEDFNKMRQSAVTRTSNNILRSSGGHGRSALSQSMTALRSDDDLKSSLRVTVDNERPDSRSKRSATERRSHNSLRSSTRGDRPAMSQSTTRRLVVDNDRPASRLRNSTGNLRSSTRGDGLTRSLNERPDSRLRSSSIEQRNHDNLRSSTRGDRMTLSQSSDARDVNDSRRSGTRGDGSDSNFGNLLRQASARRYTRRSSGDTDKNDIEALKRNLIL